MRIATKSTGIGCTAGLMAALCLSVSARGAERLILANGFDLLCHHHALVDGRVRVYLHASQPDFVEFAPDAISSYESVPDPVAPAPQAATPAAKAPPEANISATRFETRLSADDLHLLLAQAGSEHHVDEDLLASLVKAESGGNTRAVSHAGARGLMQLMPKTAQQLGVADSFQPEQNVRGGTAYLDALLTRYHDNIALALAAYNAGPEAVDRYHGIPPFRETQVYVARVVHEFNRRVRARANSQSNTSANVQPGVAPGSNGIGTETAGNATGNGGNAGVGRD